MTITYAILALAVVLVFWLIALYNGLIAMKNRVDEAYSDIDVQLKRRYDLIPNLVNTVKGYMTHEADTLEKVTAARVSAMSAHDNTNMSVEEKAKVENELSGALKSLFAVAESYPDLKASENFAKLQDELSDTENKIQASRRFYNGNVRDFNTKIQVFPSNLVANMLKFVKYDFFAADESEKGNVEVKF